jgi:hypothetical protein
MKDMARWRIWPEDMARGYGEWRIWRGGGCGEVEDMARWWSGEVMVWGGRGQGGVENERGHRTLPDT